MLEGVKIVEVEGIGPGPFAAMHLADLGADVIVVHRPGGNATPGIAAKPLLDRGKRSIALDLKAPEDQEILRKLIGWADGLIEGFRPGVMEKLGFGPDACHAINPALVYGRMTGWGQGGALATQAGHDLNYIALSGALWHASLPGTPPQTPPTVVGDIGGGALYLVIGMLAGVMRARTTGEGTVVDAAIVDGSAHMLNLLMMLQQDAPAPARRGTSLLDGPHWSRCYATRDGGHISVQCLEAKFYALFLARLDLADDPRFARQYDPEAWPMATRVLEGIFAAQDRQHWAEVFAGSDACVAPVLSPQEAADHPINAERGHWMRAGGHLQGAPAPRFSQDGARRPGPVPERDANRDEILAEVGRSLHPRMP